VSETKKKMKLSLRSRMVMIMSLVVVIVSFVIVFFSTKMIYKDKRAYLYDNAFASIETSTSALTRFFLNKKNLILALRNSLPTKEKELVEYIKSMGDPDLFKLNIMKVKGTEITSERTIYTNEEYYDKYRKRESFLEYPDGIFPAYIKDVVENGSKVELYFKRKSAVRLFIFVNFPKKKQVMVFDYMLDRTLESVFGNYPFEISLVHKKDGIVYHSKPFKQTDDHSPFFVKFIKKQLDKQKDSKSKKSLSGVKETDVGEIPYIVSYKQMKFFENYFVFSGLRTKEAYEVTELLILNTMMYALGLVGLFNILSIFLARTITNPLNRLNDVIQEIAGGKFATRVPEQSTSELQVVGDSFNVMIDTIQEYNEKLQEYNRTLETKVEERTAELKDANDFIKTMIDSLSQGLLVFGADGKVLPLYTTACEKLFGVSPKGKDLAQVVKAPDKKLFKDWVGNLFEEMIPFESMLELGMKHVPHTTDDYKDAKFSHVTLEYFPIRNAENQIDNVVLVATDETKEFRAAKQVEEQQNYVKLVTKVLGDKRGFMRFVGMFEDSMDQEINKIKNDQYDKDEFMRLLHSMKGSAAFYAFNELVNFLHHFETDVSGGKLEGEAIIERVGELRVVLKENVDKLNELIGDSATSDSNVEVDEEKLRAFWKYLNPVKNKIAAGKFFEMFLAAPVESYIEQYKQLVLDLAPQLGKKVHPINIIGGDIAVDREYFQKFFDSCIHLFRNAVDHAIEKPDVRMAAGKPEEGTINVQFAKVEAEVPILVFSVQDDGGGIDPARIRNKLKELEYSEEEINEPDEKIIYHIFDPSFSTADEITDVSGRGVGLYDIKANLEELGGSLEIQSKVGAGSVFSFYIPLPLG
jgi:two-component system chemotaxis sensor kinase CheA